MRGSQVQGTILTVHRVVKWIYAVARHFRLWGGNCFPLEICVCYNRENAIFEIR